MKTLSNSKLFGTFSRKETIRSKKNNSIKTNLSNQRHTGDVLLSRTHFENSTNFFSTNNFSTMEKIYTNTNSLKETQTTRSTSISTNSLSGSASFFKSFALALVMLVVGIGSVWGQAARYNYTTSSGTYTEITGGTVVSTTAWDDNVSTLITIPSFVFNGTAVTKMSISANGWIAIGGTAATTSTTTYTALSSAITATGASGVICAFGRDLNSTSTGEVRWQTVGSETVIQWKNYTPYLAAGNLNFQIRLNHTTNTISLVYGTMSVGSNATSPQVGIKNGVAAGTIGTTMLNLTLKNIPTGTSCLSWSNAVRGRLTTETMLFTNATPVATVASGTTFTFTPQSGLTSTWVAPVTGTGAPTLITGTGATINWTVPALSNRCNLQFRKATDCAWTNFSGNPITVTASSTASASLTGLTAATVYHVRVQPFVNGGNTAGYSHIFSTTAGTNTDGYVAAGSFTTLSPPAQPSAIVGTLDAEPGSSQTYSVTNVASVTYTWSFPPTWTITGGQSTNSVTVTVGTQNGTISVTPSNTAGNGTARTTTSTIPNYRWKYISSNLGAATWTGGEARNISITIKNTGVATWNTTYPNNIGVRWNSTTGSLSGTPWSDYHVRNSVGSLASGAQGTITLAIEAKNATAGPVYGSNLADGTYYLAFDVVSESQCWFAGNTGTCGPGNAVFYSAAQTVASTPSLSCSALTAFGNVCTNTTPTNSFTISGVNLTNSVSVGSVTGYTYSTTSNGTYTSTITLTPSSGSLNQTVYVKFTPTAATAYSGSISVTSPGATGQSVSVSGTGITAPTVSAGADFNLCSGQTVAMNASTDATSASGSVSATYSGGNGNTLQAAAPTNTTNSSCPIPLSVTVPSGAVITGVNVSYSMSTAAGASAGDDGWLSEQRSYVKCTSVGGTSESAIYSGTGNVTGTQPYSRNNLTIANGVSGGGTINFELHAFRTYGGTGTCNATWNLVNNGTFTVTVNYTTNPTYSWSPATALSATNVLNPNCSATTTRTYTLIVTGTNGCSASDQVVATVAGGSVPTTPTAAVSGSSTINVGGTTTLTSTAGANTVWYTTATEGSSVGSGDNWQTPVQCVSGTITYYAEDNNGTCASASRTAVLFTVRPMVVSNPANGLICQAGGSVTLSTQLTGGSPITWSPNTNLSTTSGASTIASPTATTVYTMSATVVGCGSVSATQAVGVIDAVDFTPTSTPASVCAGNTAVLASNLASSGFTYSTTTFSMASPSSPTNLASAGVASVALTSGNMDDGGWQNIPIGFTYNFFGNNYTTLNVGTNGVLLFGAYNSTSLGDYSYATSFPTATEPTNVIAAGANDFNATSGTIRYWIQGIAPTRTFVVEWNAIPGYVSGSTTSQIKLFETTGNVEIHISNNNTVGYGSITNKVVGLQNADASIGATAYSNTGTITNTAWKFIPGANSTFQWATAGANIGSATATSYTTPALNTPGTVSYSVSATNPNTQCATTKTVSLVVNALPAAPNSSGDVTACGNASNQNLVVTVGAGETADWYAAGTGGSILTSPNGAATTSLTVPSGSSVGYYAQAKNTTTSCTSSSRTLVSYSSGAVPVSPTSSGATYCQGVAAAALSASAPSGTNTQNWYTVSTAGSALSGAPTPSTATATTLTYYVGETGTNGCESTRTAVSVVVNPTPAAPTASNPSPYCENAAASALSATSDGSSTLYWYTVPTGGTGSTTAITPSTSSSGSVNYYVAQRTAQNCESPRASIAVDVNPSITASVANGASSTSACGASAITFTASPTNGGSSPTYQWYLNGSAVGNGASTYVTNPAADNAGNYSGTWNSGSNQGSGMGPWAFTVGSSSGAFIGNPSNDGNGIAGIGTSAHGLFATGNAYINTARNFSTPMQIGDELRFYWVFNWDANGGSKGFDLKASGSTIFNVNNGGSSTITAGGATADAGYGTTPMYVTVKRTSASVYTFTMTRRSDGTTYTATFNNSNAIDGINFYVGNQNDGSGNRNLYFNGLEMRPPQASDAIYVEMTPSAQACLTSASAVSSSTITLTSTASTPTVAIQSSAASAVCSGVPVTFSVNTSANMGSGPSYQWKLNGTNITGANSPTYASSALANNDQISLEMTSSLSPVCLTAASAQSSTIATAVSTSTSITSQPAASSACASGSTSFTVSGAGQGTLTYQWKKGGNNVTGNQSATTNVLTLSGVSASDIGDYTVDVTGSCGSVTSNTAAFTINPATSITSQPTISSQCAGSNATFTVAGTGHNTLSYQWNYNGSAISGATSATLVESSITSADAGQYSVVVTGGCGAVTSSNAQLTVQPATTISTQPAASALCAGNTANFSVTASGTGALSYQWKKDGSNVGTSSSTLSVANSQAVDAGTYTVDVTGTCGTITSNNSLLTVNPLTTITAQPVATSGCQGQNTTFTVVAAGTGVLSYQWKFGGVNISGATSASYNIPSTTSADDGSYLVAVTGGCGTAVNSNTVALNVVQPTINITVNTASIGNSDYLWNGNTSTDGSVASNWYVLNSNVYSVASQAPTAATEVFIVSYTDASTCVSQSNSASIPASGSFTAGNMYIGTSASIALGTSAALNVSGNFTNNGTFNPGTGTVNMNGSSAQTINGSAAITFNNLIINNPAGVSLNTEINTNGILTLTNGVLSLGSQNLYIGTGGSIAVTSPSASRMISTSGSGELRKRFAQASNQNPANFLFPIGTPGEYTPVNLDFSDVDFGNEAYMRARSVAQKSGFMNASISNYLDRNWIVEPVNISNFTYDITYTYAQADYVGSAGAEGQLKPIKYSTPGGVGQWYQPLLAGFDNAEEIGEGTVNSATNVAQWTGLNSFSEFGGAEGNGQPLPVELVSFTGACEEGVINLTWQTASEFNSEHFDVEKSRDGENWLLLTTMPAAGTSNELITYQYGDDQATDGNNYFRLRQVDIDGTEKLYDPINVSCKEVTTGYFTSYPNPSGNSFQIIVNNKELLGNCVMNIVDASGKVIEQLNIEVKEGINLFMINQALNPGIYFLNITNGDKSTPVVRHAVN